ncbi:hypothetical protein CC1G_13839 [Coprinopsis cinerea okayama7|uniref:Uncharacterized protein n=1 Tax=Coprinopsis cinerea (strain Okayama-7 / 130 / ATCC MYA-4618 / FGSC 9003) TaxID=240176 RepID=D6RKK1_COPC7|nr:hypothetical protein CC1G_13839 [Coprinopsis cinerea okayama7\|eukprot:XP_002911804.1 hypothetical protein CC1G_13839 [Coprinopsis cinerea okayama7\
MIVSLELRSIMINKDQTSHRQPLTIIVKMPTKDFKGALAVRAGVLVSRQLLMFDIDSDIETETALLWRLNELPKGKNVGELATVEVRAIPIRRGNSNTAPRPSRQRPTREYTEQERWWTGRSGLDGEFLGW